MLVAALVVGILIGCVGIGGVLLTPALVYVADKVIAAANATRKNSFSGKLPASCSDSSVSCGTLTWHPEYQLQGVGEQYVLPNTFLLLLLLPLMLMSLRRHVLCLIRGSFSLQDACRIRRTYRRLAVVLYSLLKLLLGVTLRCHLTTG